MINIDNNIYKRQNKVMHLAEAFYTNLMVQPCLPIISKTGITPNNITIFNMIIASTICYLGFQGKLKLLGVLIQIYLFLDILDGNLARYKKNFSELGAKLDCYCDRIFYNMLFICLGYNRITNIKLILVLIFVNLYALIPSVYIVPRLRKLKTIKRFGLKRSMFKKGYLIGMDLGTVDFITTIFSILGKIDILFTILIIGYIYDLVYRIIELKYNEKLNRD